MSEDKINIFWFRRDLRLDDNIGLQEALNGNIPVLPLFIFDENIVTELKEDDARITFIYEILKNINTKLKDFSSSILIKKGSPIEVWKSLINEYQINGVFTNEDYEPYAINRDKKIGQYLSEKGIFLKPFKDQVIFAKNEVLKADGTPYTVFTPYKNKWLERLKKYPIVQNTDIDPSNFAKNNAKFPELSDLGFKKSAIKVLDFNLENLGNYKEIRNFPALNQTSNLSPHLRFGTVSIRNLVIKTAVNPVFLSELVWREFFMQILFHFPDVVHSNFKSKYDGVKWRNNKEDFEKWKNGQTGFPMVDAGIRELNETGYMHNRVRMVVAGFLCKHLLIDWRWGEAYFAEKLLDYELSSNNGNWQWSAGTGCDSAPYFRIFNPTTQIKKFDPDLKYIKKWVPELNSLDYPQPIVDHKMARERALKVYKEGLN